MKSPFASLNWGRPTASKRAVYRLRLTDTSVEENMDEITFAEAGVEEYYFDNLLDVLRLARARFHQINEGYLEEAGYEEAFDPYLEDFSFRIYTPRMISQSTIDAYPDEIIPRGQLETRIAPLYGGGEVFLTPDYSMYISDLTELENSLLQVFKLPLEPTPNSVKTPATFPFDSNIISPDLPLELQAILLMFNQEIIAEYQTLVSFMEANEAEMKVSASTMNIWTNPNKLYGYMNEVIRYPYKLFDITCYRSERLMDFEPLVDKSRYTIQVDLLTVLG